MSDGIKCSTCGGKGVVESLVPDGTGDMFCHDCDGKGVRTVGGLTPRVGDRVIVRGKPGSVVTVTTCGTVIETRAPIDPGRWYVQVDTLPDAYHWHEDDLTVVDREPVEWPEDWGARTFEQRNGVGVICHVATSSTHVTLWNGDGDKIHLTREEVGRLAVTAAQMRDGWDGLIRGDS